MADVFFDLSGKGTKRSTDNFLPDASPPPHHKKADFDFTSHSQPIMSNKNRAPGTVPPISHSYNLSHSQPIAMNSHDPIKTTRLPSPSLQDLPTAQKGEYMDLLGYYMEKKAARLAASSGNDLNTPHQNHNRPMYRENDYQVATEYQQTSRPNYAEGSERNMSMTQITERLRKLEAENEEKSRIIANLEEKINRDSVRHQETIAMYRKANSDQYQDFLNMEHHYNETVQTYIQESTSNQSGTKSQENVQKLMKSLTALDVMEQTETKTGISFFCVIHGVIMDFKFYIMIPHDKTKEIDYMPHDTSQLSDEEKSLLPGFLLDSISFNMDVLPKFFWRLASTLQKK